MNRSLRFIRNYLNFLWAKSNNSNSSRAELLPTNSSDHALHFARMPDAWGTSPTTGTKWFCLPKNICYASSTTTVGSVPGLFFLLLWGHSVRARTSRQTQLIRGPISAWDAVRRGKSFDGVRPGCVVYPRTNLGLHSFTMFLLICLRRATDQTRCLCHAPGIKGDRRNVEKWFRPILSDVVFLKRIYVR
jgi:hypothetical protein